MTSIPRGTAAPQPITDTRARTACLERSSPAPTCFRLEVPGTRQSVPSVRRWVRAVCHHHPRADDIELFASELATNAWQHSHTGLPGGRYWVRLELWPDNVVELSVYDQGSCAPAPEAADAPADDYAEDGRGLGIVADLAPGLTVHVTPFGRCVTVRVPPEPPPDAA